MTGTCSIEGCIRPLSGKGLCKLHYDRLPENKEKAKQRIASPERKENIRFLARERGKLPKTKLSKRKWDLRWRYGLTLEEYETMEKNQNGCCAICKTPFEKNGEIDHNHTSGKIRGLLCHHCNIALGSFKDNPEILKNAIRYLEASQQ